MSRGRSSRGLQSRPARRNCEQGHMSSMSAYLSRSHLRWPFVLRSRLTIKTYPVSGGSPPTLSSSNKSQNCPWISPQMVTGLETGWMFDSSISRERTVSQRDLMSGSGRYLHCRSVEMYRSRSAVMLEREGGESAGRESKASSQSTNQGASHLVRPPARTPARTCAYIICATLFQWTEFQFPLSSLSALPRAA